MRAATNALAETTQPRRAGAPIQRSTTMGKTEVWSTIHVERAALDADLQPLTAVQWDTPSLCPGWSVRDVLGHMTATNELTPPKFFASIIGSGFSFEKLQRKA